MHLAATLPPAVLADALNLTPATAVGWGVHAAGGDWCPAPRWLITVTSRTGMTGSAVARLVASVTGDLDDRCPSRGLVDQALVLGEGGDK